MDEHKEQENNPINPENNEPNQDVPDFMTDSGEQDTGEETFQNPEEPAAPESPQPPKSEVVLEQPTVQGQPAAAFPAAETGQAQATTQIPTEEIPTHLFPAILSTVCCCMPLGVVAIVCAAMVNSKLVSGDVEGAWKMSKMAKIFAYGAIAIGIVGNLIAFALYFMGFFFQAASYQTM